MKAFMLVILVTMVTKGYAMDMEVADTCVVWADFNTEQTIYNETKKNMKAQGLDIDEIEPKDIRRVRVLKVKFEREKKKFEKNTGMKFKSSMCRP